jgi:phosphatidylinositol 4-kinase
LIDIEGHIMHIDFGFLLSNAPGKGLKFEQAPFKLTGEMVEVLGGIKSKRFKEFREHMRLGFMAIQEHADKIIKLVEMMFMGLSDLPCFVLGEDLIGALKERIFPRITTPSSQQPGRSGDRGLMGEAEAALFIDRLV